MSKKTKKVLFKKGQRVQIDRDEEPGRNIGKLAVVQDIEPGGKSEPTYVLKVDGVNKPAKYKQSWLLPVTTLPSSLLANDLFLPWEMTDPKPRLNAFLGDKVLLGDILERSLFYEQVVIPTVDLAIIVPLVHWFGPFLLRDLLNAEAIRFVRSKGTLAYFGNGNGLQMFEIHPGDGKPDDWWVRSSRCPVEEAVELQLRNRLRGLTNEDISLIAKLVALCTTETLLPEFTSKVENETYRDILASPILRDHFAIRNTNLKQLTGVEANQARVLNILRGKPPADEIDITLRLGMLNLEAYLGEESGARDMVTDRGFRTLLSAKVDRFTGGKVAADSFSQLARVEKLPDIAHAIVTGQVKAEDVWRFRENSEARNFRKWFDKTGPKEPSDLVAEYVETLRAGSVWTQGVTKHMRFLVVQGASLVVSALTAGVGGILANLGLSAVDSYLLEKIRLGYNPRYFIDDMRHQLFPEIGKDKR